MPELSVAERLILLFGGGGGIAAAARVFGPHLLEWVGKRLDPETLRASRSAEADSRIRLDEATWKRAIDTINRQAGEITALQANKVKTDALISQLNERMGVVEHRESRNRDLIRNLTNGVNLLIEQLEAANIIPVYRPPDIQEFEWDGVNRRKDDNEPRA